MIIKILGAESLGVRGLSCSVELKNRKILIDPGIALGWRRYRLLPHPFQVLMGVNIRERVIEQLKSASDVIISHFDGDHCPLARPNPYQLGIDEVKDSLSRCRIWALGPDHCPPTQHKRRGDLAEILNRDLISAEGRKEGSLEFSLPVAHGRQGGAEHRVMMTRIEDQGESFVHASDTQLYDETAIEFILDWKPDVVLVSGPPLYHHSGAGLKDLSERGRENALKLSRHVPVVIIDHHLLRSQQGIDWLNELKGDARNQICCAADFMTRQALFLEAWRNRLYEWLPVREHWHDDYEQGRTDLEPYRIQGWEALIARGKIQPCKWYPCCPIKEYTEAGKLERDWIEQYCLVGNRNCVRYQMEESGQPHPDSMLPNGKIREELA